MNNATGHHRGSSSATVQSKQQPTGAMVVFFRVENTTTGTITNAYANK